MSPEVTISVLIITYRRPQFLREQLEHLARQDVPPGQVLVVDASPDEESAQVAAAHPTVTYVRNPAGAGNMTSSRNAGLAHVRGDVIAFLDDDAYPRPDYVQRLRDFVVQHAAVAIGCCRAVNDVPGEAARGVDEIGTFDGYARLTGNFAADPGRDLPVDHGLGATMWIRTSLMRELGGFREYFPGTAAREDTDLFLRARQLGHQAWFVRGAVAQHVAAPQEGGERFDRRYTYWSAHNHALLLLAAYGCRDVRFWRSLVRDVLAQLTYGGPSHRRVARAVLVGAAWGRGIVFGMRLFGPGPRPPVGAYRRP